MGFLRGGYEKNFTIQGDQAKGSPVSLPIHICAEALSSLLHHAMMSGCITGVPTSKRGPRLSHLFFADDGLLFCKANSVEWR